MTADRTLKTRIAEIIRFDAAFDDLVVGEAQSESVAERVIAEAACWPINVDANTDQYDRTLEQRYMTDDVFHARVYAAARAIESGGPWPTAEDAAMAILDAAERQVPTVDSPIEHAIEDPRNREAIRRALKAAADKVSE